MSWQVTKTSLQLRRGGERREGGGRGRTCNQELCVLPHLLGCVDLLQPLHDPVIESVVAPRLVKAAVDLGPAEEGNAPFWLMIRSPCLQPNASHLPAIVAT